MGGTWSQSESWYNLVTKDEVRDAMRGFHEWEKAQAETKASGVVKPALPTTGPLVERIGGPDAVKRVVEGFCRRLYADKRLQGFLQGRDIIYMRAKLSTFATWLFGPAHQPYTGKHLRTAHLRLIKQRGFTPEDFERGMEYFQEAIRELGIPEALVNEAMAKLRPFKGAVFTASSRDTEEEARWAAEERAKELQLRLQQRQAEQRLQAEMEEQQRKEEQLRQEQAEKQPLEQPQPPPSRQRQQPQHQRPQSKLYDERGPLHHPPSPVPGNRPSHTSLGLAAAHQDSGAWLAATNAATPQAAQCPFTAAGGRMPRSASTTATAASASAAHRGPSGGGSQTATGFSSPPSTMTLQRVSPSASAPSTSRPASTSAIPTLGHLPGSTGGVPPPALAALPPGLAALPPPPPLRSLPLARVSQPSSGAATPRSLGVGPVSASSRDHSTRSSFTGGAFATAFSTMDSPGRGMAA